MWQCPDCGFRVTGGIEDADERHECHPDGIARTQAARIDDELAAFLATPEGRFEQHYAQRTIRKEAA